MGRVYIYYVVVMATVTEILHYPTLKTVLLVENILREAKEPLSRYDIMKKMNNRLMHQTLNVIIQYFVEKNMVLDTPKGILWVYTSSKKIDEWLNDSVRL